MVRRVRWCTTQTSNAEALLKKYLDTMHGIIVRVNPAEYAGVTRSRLEALLMAQKKRGAVVMSTPDVQRSMGAKDALCRISGLRCGLVDTLAYYSAEELDAGFRMSMAFQPRVVKQNRGSQGEGIWICKLKDESTYCKNFGDRVCGLDEMLVLVEACDNHVEEHTVGEFLEFCVKIPKRRSSKEWVTALRLIGGRSACLCTRCSLDCHLGTPRIAPSYSPVLCPRAFGGLPHVHISNLYLIQMSTISHPRQVSAVHIPTCKIVDPRLTDTKSTPPPGS